MSIQQLKIIDLNTTVCLQYEMLITTAIKLCPNGATNLRAAVAKNGKVILYLHPEPDQHQNRTPSRGSPPAHLPSLIEIRQPVPELSSGQIHRQTDRQTDTQIDRQTDRHTDRHTPAITIAAPLRVQVNIKSVELVDVVCGRRQTDRQTYAGRYNTCSTTRAGKYKVSRTC